LNPCVASAVILSNFSLVFVGVF